MSQEQELVENTIATEQNTVATQNSGNSGGISRMTAAIAGMLLAATCFVSFINPTFAENQAGIIFSAVAGGVFGAATSKFMSK